MATPEKKTGPTREGEISPVAQNYLLTLYMMKEEEDGPVTMTKLAEQLAASPATEHLGTSLASVAGMIRRMKRGGLLDILPSKELAFTRAGLHEAQAVMRRHQLAERLLVDVLGVELRRVHAEAHRLEHAISPDVERKIAERLGNPERCPFGHAIPGSGYTHPATALPLVRAEPGTALVVERIPEENPKLVDYLAQHGVLPGATMTVREVAPYRGTITLDVQGVEVVVGLQVAPRILVRPADGRAVAPKALREGGQPPRPAATEKKQAQARA